MKSRRLKKRKPGAAKAGQRESCNLSPIFPLEGVETKPRVARPSCVNLGLYFHETMNATATLSEKPKIMKTHLEKSADSHRANCPETKSWPLGQAIWLAVLCLAVWAVGPRASAQTPPGLDLQLYAGLTITGAVGTVYSIEYVTDLAQTNNPSAWRCLEFLQLPASPYLWADKSAPATGQRFYRAVVFAAPTNMVFIPPGTFRMGSPTNEVDRYDR